MISLLLPTRGRISELQRFHESVFQTADAPDNIEIICYVDNDDKSYDGLELKQTKFVRGERIVLSEMWNKCFEVASGEILGHMGDDIIFRSQGWDTYIFEAINKFPDKIVFVYGKDGFSPTDFGTHGFIHRKWAEISGFFVPPYFSSDYNDTWFNDVAKAIGRHIHIPEVYTEHMHWINGKGAKDQTHLDRLARHTADNVAQIYENKKGERDENAQKLLNYIKNFRLNKVTLSILIPSARPLHLNRLLLHLTKQIEHFNLQDEVEIVTYEDKFETPLYEKRNKLLNEARGTHLVFIDDDDAVASDYLPIVVEVIKRDNPDYIGYRVLVAEQGFWHKQTIHSLKNATLEDDDFYYRKTVSHINPIRSSIAKQTKFPEKTTKEDVEWASQLKLVTETYIDQVMYFYNSDRSKTLTSGEENRDNQYLNWTPRVLVENNIRRL